MYVSIITLGKCASHATNPLSASWEIKLSESKRTDNRKGQTRNKWHQLCCCLIDGILTK